ncbi:MAG: ROK family protein, partial [Clostridia bacterium]|nr:ROK family protein [Clostridia bacterium]
MYIFGVDIGGTGIKSGIVDETGKIVIKSSIPTNADAGYEVIIKNLANQLKKLCEDSGIALSEVSAIGIGCPGAINSKKGTVDYSNNLRWTDVPLVDELHKYFDLPIKVSND